MNNLFESRSSAALLFQADLAKLAAVFGHYARAIQCLESPHTTCSDVYLYWLAIVSQMSQLLKGNTVELEDETKARIREITNMRFNQMINKAPNDPYITAFYLHPGMYPNMPQSPIVALIIWPEYRGANIYSNINPLDVPEVRISISRSAASKVIPPEEQIATRITKALGHILMHEYGNTYDGKRSDEEAAEMMKSRNPRLAGILPRDAVVELKTQLADYRLRVDPFNRPMRAGETALGWWTSVQKNPHAQVLGVSPFTYRSSDLHL